MSRADALLCIGGTKAGEYIHIPQFNDPDCIITVSIPDLQFMDEIQWIDFLGKISKWSDR